MDMVLSSWEVEMRMQSRCWNVGLFRCDAGVEKKKGIHGTKTVPNKMFQSYFHTISLQLHGNIHRIGGGVCDDAGIGIGLIWWRWCECRLEDGHKRLGDGIECIRYL